MRKWIGILLVLAIILAFTACGGSSHPLVGRWEMTDMSGWGLGSDGREAREELLSGDIAFEYRFFQDGRVSVTITSELDSEVSWGDWSSENGIVRISGVDYFYDIVNSQLTLTHSTWGRHDINMHFQRVS